MVADAPGGGNEPFPPPCLPRLCDVSALERRRPGHRSRTAEVGALV